MKIISTNIAKPRTIIWNEKEVQTGIYKNPVSTPLFLGKTGIPGDTVMDKRFHGGALKAVYIYGKNRYPFWQKKYPNLDWQHGFLGENLTFDVFDESIIKIGDIFQIGNAKVQITQPRKPCYKLGIRFNTQQALKDFINEPYPGGYLQVLEEGEVNVDDEVILLDSNPNQMSLADVYYLIYHKNGDQKMAEKALELDIFPETCKKNIRRNYFPESK